MRVVIQPDYAHLSRWAAHYVAWRIRKFAPTAERPFVLGLPTGGTPEGMYKHLVEIHQGESCRLSKW